MDAIRGYLPIVLEVSGLGAIVWAVGALLGLPAAVFVAGAAAIAVAYHMEG